MIMSARTGDTEPLAQLPGNYISHWISASDYSRKQSTLQAHLLLHTQLASSWLEHFY